MKTIKPMTEQINFREYDFVPVTGSSIVFELVTQIVEAANFSAVLAYHCYWRQVSPSTIEILIPNTLWSARLRSNILTVPGVESVGSVSYTGFDHNILVVTS